MSRPTKYDDAKAEQIAQRLRAGCTRKAAVQSVGIDYVTFLNWISRYSSFSSLIATSESHAEVTMTAHVFKAAQEGEWKAALEWLKRRRRDEWGDSLNLTKTNDDDLLREAAAIVNRTGAGSAGGSDTSGADA